MKRTKKDIIIKSLKYILLLILIFVISIVSLEKEIIYMLVYINLIIYIYMICYILIYKRDLLISKISNIDIMFLILALIFMCFTIIKNFNIFGVITILTIFSLYFLGIDILRVIIKKSKIKKISLYLIEYILLLKNNLFEISKNDIQEKNILILISRLNNGGAERVAANLANNFIYKYNNVIVVTYNSSSENDYECKANRINIKNNEISRIIELKRIKKKHNITHCISFCTKANYLNIASNNGEKKIISIRNYLSLHAKEKGLKKIEAKIASKFADEIVTVAKAIEIDQEKNYKANKNKIITINNFCESNIIKEKIANGILTEKEQEFFNKYDVIITIGRLSYQKGQWHIIKAFKEVIKEYPKARLIILGDGEYREILKNLINTLGMKEYIKLYGFKENPYIYLSKSKMFVLSSLYEGMSNVILEAMSCGLPIIATDCLAGNREILAPNTDITKNTDKMELAKYGIIVPVGDCKFIENENLTKEENELKNAILKMLKEKSIMTKYQEQSQIRIKDFDKNKIIEQWYDLIGGNNN